MPSPRAPRPHVLVTVLPILAIAVAAACSGGGDDGPAPAPAIVEFRAERADYRLGERARLRVRYVGGPARIDPGAVPVGRDSWFETDRLALSNTFELVVGEGAEQVRRSVTVAAPYRERFREVPLGFSVSNHATVATADGGALVIGGDQGLSILGYEIFRFEPETETFRSFGQLFYGRDDHRAVRIDEHRILVVGGTTSAIVVGPPSEIVDDRTGDVTLTGAVQRFRIGHTATRLADGRVLVLGGNSNDSIEPGVRASAEIWSPQTGQFRLLPHEMTKPRVGHTATLLADGRVLVYGGTTRDDTYVAAEVFDPATETFTPLTDPEVGVRADHAAVQLDATTLLIAGGQDAASAPLKSGLLLDLSTGTFRAAKDLAVRRTQAVAEALADGRVLFAGGVVDDVGTPTTKAELVSGDASAAPVADMARARRYHTVTRLTSGLVLVVGGVGPGGVLRNTAEIFD